MVTHIGKSRIGDSQQVAEQSPGIGRRHHSLANLVGDDDQFVGTGFHGTDKRVDLLMHAREQLVVVRGICAPCVCGIKHVGQPQADAVNEQGAVIVQANCAHSVG